MATAIHPKMWRVRSPPAVGQAALLQPIGSPTLSKSLYEGAGVVDGWIDGGLVVVVNAAWVAAATTLARRV
jgi:hypothetical protein